MGRFSRAAQRDWVLSFVASRRQRRKQRRKMKTKGLLLISLLIFFCLVFSPPDSAAQGLTKLAVGYPGSSGDHLAMWGAKETGIFAKNGLDVNLIFFMGTAAAALISGDVPISYLAGPQVIN